MKEVIAETIVPEHRLRIFWTQFECPYCNKTWQRGGHKEGFVKSAANNHVAACWEVALFLRGFMLHRWLQTKGRTAIPIEDKRKQPGGARHVKAVRALVTSRARAGSQVRTSFI